MRLTLLTALLLATSISFTRAEDKAKPDNSAAAKPTENVAPETAITLFDGKSMDDWESVDVGGSGTAEVVDGLLTLTMGDSVSGVVYKKAKDLPRQNYEITLEAMRTQGVDFFCGLTFPVGPGEKDCATLVLGGWGGSVTGISSIDGLDASENNTGSYQRFKDNQWYAVRLRVTPKEIKVWIDGKEIINTDTEGKKLSLRPGPMENYIPLSLTTYATAAAYRNVKLTTLPRTK